MKFNKLWFNVTMSVEGGQELRNRFYRFLEKLDKRIKEIYEGKTEEDRSLRKTLEWLGIEKFYHVLKDAEDYEKKVAITYIETDKEIFLVAGLRKIFDVYEPDKYALDIEIHPVRPLKQFPENVFNLFMEMGINPRKLDIHEGVSQVYMEMEKGLKNFGEAFRLKRGADIWRYIGR